MDAVDTGVDISLMIQAGKSWVNDAHVAESPRSASQASGDDLRRSRDDGTALA